MATNAKPQTNEAAESPVEESATVAELKAIKRLLALLLLQNGAQQKVVAKAAGVRLLTINQMAKGVAKARRIQLTESNSN